MINTAIVGLGWWGKTLVEAVQHDSPDLHFVAGTTRTITPAIQAFADAQTGSTCRARRSTPSRRRPAAAPRIPFRPTR